MVDAEISDRVFGSKSGNDKSRGRKFYWDGPIEVEMPNKVQRSISFIVPRLFVPIFSVYASHRRFSEDEKLRDKRTGHG